MNTDLAASPVCPESRGWGQSRGDKWTGPDPAYRTMWVLGIFQHNGKRQEGTAVVWEKGPAEASEGEERRVRGCVQRDDAVSRSPALLPCRPGP